MPTPQFGDVIFASRFGYNHYGIYSGNNKVIHYCKDDNGICNGIIKETSLNTFLNGDKLYICKFNEATVNSLRKNGLLLGGLALLMINPVTAGAAALGKIILGAKALDKAHDLLSNDSEEHRAAKNVFTPEETVTRARSKLGQDEYNLVVHNCEHFAIWCKTGVESSEQINQILRIVSPIPI